MAPRNPKIPSAGSSIATQLPATALTQSALPTGETTGRSLEEDLRRGDPGERQVLPTPPAPAWSIEQENQGVEYVSTFQPAYAPFVNPRVLPASFDDLTRGVRDDVYEQMMLDSQVSSCFGTIIESVFGGGIEILPYHRRGVDTTDADRQVAAECQEMLDNLESSLQDDVGPDMMEAMIFGSRVAELVYYPTDRSPLRDKLVLRSVKPKSRKVCAFVADKYMNVLGFQPLTDPTAQQGMIPSKVLPRDKFTWLSWRPQNADPRGRSDGRSGYVPWFYKSQLLPEAMKFAALCATPSLVGNTAEDAQRIPKKDANGQIMKDASGQVIYIDPADKMLAEMMKFRSGSSMVIPNSAKVSALELSGNGQIYQILLDMFDHWIAKAILYQTLATESSEGSSKQASKVHQDVLSMKFAYAKRKAATWIRSIFARVVALNYGPYAPVPFVNVPGVGESVFLERSSAVAKLKQVSFLHPSQYQAIDSYLGLPPRSQESIDLETERFKTDPQQETGAGGGAGNPAGNVGGTVSDP